MTESQLLEGVPEEFLLADVEQSEQLLGRGSYGGVYLGSWRGTPVAIKRLWPMLILDEHRKLSVAYRQFLLEFPTLRDYPHPNIVQVFGMVRPRSVMDSPGLVMEYLSDTLRECYVREPPLSTLDEVDVALGITSGLTYLHERRLLHRDLTTNNVMLAGKMADGRLRAKITDVGGGKLLLDNTQAQTMSMNPGAHVYMAPETQQALADPTPGNLQTGTAKYGMPADIYSLGVTVLSMCNRREPSSIWVLAAKGRGCDIAALRRDHPLCPMVENCLEEEPGKRHSATEVCQSLMEIRANLSQAEADATPAEQQPEEKQNQEAMTESQLHSQLATIQQELEQERQRFAEVSAARDALVQERDEARSDRDKAQEDLHLLLEARYSAAEEERRQLVLEPSKLTDPSPQQPAPEALMPQQQELMAAIRPSNSLEGSLIYSGSSSDDYATPSSLNERSGRQQDSLSQAICADGPNQPQDQQHTSTQPVAAERSPEKHIGVHHSIEGRFNDDDDDDEPVLVSRRQRNQRSARQGSFGAERQPLAAARSPDQPIGPHRSIEDQFYDAHDADSDEPVLVSRGRQNQRSPQQGSFGAERQPLAAARSPETLFSSYGSIKNRFYDAHDTDRDEPVLVSQGRQNQRSSQQGAFGTERQTGDSLAPPVWRPPGQLQTEQPESAPTTQPPLYSLSSMHAHRSMARHSETLIGRQEKTGAVKGALGSSEPPIHSIPTPDVDQTSRTLRTIPKGNRSQLTPPRPRSPSLDSLQAESLENPSAHVLHPLSETLPAPQPPRSLLEDIEDSRHKVQPRGGLSNRFYGSAGTRHQDQSNDLSQSLPVTHLRSRQRPTRAGQSESSPAAAIVSLSSRPMSPVSKPENDPFLGWAWLAWPKGGLRAKRDPPEWEMCGNYPERAVKMCQRPCIHGDYLYASFTVDGLNRDIYLSSDKPVLFRAKLTEGQWLRWEEDTLPAGSTWEEDCYFFSHATGLHAFIRSGSYYHLCRRKAGRWNRLTNLPEQKYKFGLVVIGDTLLVTGGNAYLEDWRGETLRSTHSLDLSGESYFWEKEADLPKPCVYSRPAAVDNKVYIINQEKSGLFSRGTTAIGRFLVMDISASKPGKRKWAPASIPKPPTILNGLAVCSERHLVIVGGNSNEFECSDDGGNDVPHRNRSSVLQISSGKCARLPNLSRIRVNAHCLQHGQRLYVIGGEPASAELPPVIESLSISEHAVSSAAAGPR